MPNTEAKKPTIQVLERAFDLLDSAGLLPRSGVAEGDRRALGLHPSTAHRILNDLTIGRFVDRPRPAATAWACACSSSATSSRRLDVRDAALAPMRELHR